MLKTTLQHYYYFLLLLAFVFSCQAPEIKKDSKVVIRSSTDANSLNPLNSRGELSNVLIMFSFQSLTSIDFYTEELVGVIAENKPLVEKLDSNKMRISYTIREEAKFDNGRNIDANDVLFSFKLAICPSIVSPGARSYYEFIEDIQFDPKNPRSLHFICKDNYFINEYVTGDFYILPYEVYDSSQVLNAYSIKKLRAIENPEDDSILFKYGNYFSQQKFQNNPKYISGSGPYKVSDWQTNQRITLSLKPDWWGNKYIGENSYFECKSNKLQFEIINDIVTAGNALKGGQIDLMKGLSASDYENFKQFPNVGLKLEKRNALFYIGMNNSTLLLKEKYMRKVLHHLTDKVGILNSLLGGYGEIIHGPVSPSRVHEFNSSVKSPSFSMDSAKLILTENNWKDIDNDGILDKEIDGEMQHLQFRYLYNTGNDERKGVGLLLKERAKSVGMDISIEGLEWSSFLEKLSQRDFDLFMHGSSSPNLPPDFKPNYHSSSALSGRNYVNYQSPDADLIIDSIRTCLDDTQRNKLIKAFQVQINKDLPLIFLVSPLEKLAYSKRIKTPITSSVRPNYWAPSLELK